MNLRPLGLEKTGIIAKRLLKGRGRNKHTFEQAMTLLFANGHAFEKYVLQLVWSST